MADEQPRTAHEISATISGYDYWGITSEIKACPVKADKADKVKQEDEHLFINKNEKSGKAD
jgi:hypothetical protein